MEIACRKLLHFWHVRTCNKVNFHLRLCREYRSLFCACSVLPLYTRLSFASVSVFPVKAPWGWEASPW